MAWKSVERKSGGLHLRVHATLHFWQNTIAPPDPIEKEYREDSLKLHTHIIIDLVMQRFYDKSEIFNAELLDNLT